MATDLVSVVVVDLAIAIALVLVVAVVVVAARWCFLFLLCLCPHRVWRLHVRSVFVETATNKSPNGMVSEFRWRTIPQFLPGCLRRHSRHPYHHHRVAQGRLAVPPPTNYQLLTNKD